MKLIRNGASRAALLIALATAGTPALAWAQQAAPAETLEEIVVTGSLIRGTPEDAALPVEVYSQEDLEKQGAPTALEFAKTLTIAGPTTGESYYFGGVGPGFVSYNLRGIGADKTLTLLNGRRGSENASNIPSIALARTEILKDGAAVTYGADATGGVVNFITRDRFVGFEARGQYKYIRGSDGDYSVGLLGGWGEDRVNFMWSAEYEHRSPLSVMKRDFPKKSFDTTQALYNTAPWSTLTNLAGWTGRGPLPAIPSVANEFGATVTGIISDFTQESCRAVGGRYDNNFTCAYNYISYYNLVEENDVYRVYAQANAKVTDDMDFHVEASFGQVNSPHVFGSPSQPIVQGPAMATGATFQFYVPITNPHAAAFAARNGVSGVSGFTPVTYRMLGHGGNMFMGEGAGFGVPDKIESQVFRVSGGLKGRLGDWAGPARDVSYDFAVTYNHSNIFNTHPDVIGYRLQEALNGFGGPGCNAPDLDPARFGTQNPAAAGQGACKWWNPFSTSFARQPVRNLANPNYSAAAENSEELTRWMFDDRAQEVIDESITVDLVFSGTTGLTLPGGQVAWALGAQARALESRETVPSSFYNGSQPCPWPNGTTSANGPGSPNLENNPIAPNDPRFRGCTPDGPGPFVLFSTNIPNSLDQQQSSYFGELQIPVLETLSLQLAARHEQFSGDLSTTVYKVAGKWKVWGPLSLRGSYGTNYSAPPVGTTPGAVNNTARNYTIAGGNWLGAQFVTDTSLKPETAKTWNVGVIWQSRGIAEDHDVQLIVDYFDIRTKDEIGQIADPNQIANLVFNGTGGTITTCDANAQPLLRRVTFNTGCVVGMSAVGAFSSIQTLVGNGPGQTTNGFDVQASYSLPVLQGDLTLGLTATKLTELRTGPTALDGVTVSTGDNRLGTLNFATVAVAAPKLRANFSANYRWDRHNFRVGVNYVSAVRDERAGIQFGEEGEKWITLDATWRFALREDLVLTATADNILDRDPPPAQEEFSYDPRMGNALGRTFEIGVKKTF